MFERFTERARQVVVLAQEEARIANTGFIDSPHVLLGLIREEDGTAAQALASSGVTLEAAQLAVRKRLPGEAEPSVGQIPFTKSAKALLEGTLREALSLGNNYIGTEHILLAAIAHDDGSCEAILEDLGVDPDEVGGNVLNLMEVSDSDIQTWRRSRVRRRAKRLNKAMETPESKETDTPEAPEETGEFEAIEAIPTHQDRPATEDELGRGRLAEVLAERMRRVRGEDTEAAAKTRRDRRRKRRADGLAAREAGSFMVHIHAPWGAGKSSLLNFLASDLRNRRESQTRQGWRRIRDLLQRGRPKDPQLSQWIVVEFNAWEHQRLTPPWWWLLAAVQRSCHRELWRSDRRQWFKFWLRDFGWRLWNVRASCFALALIGGVLALAWRADWFGLEVSSLSALQAVFLTVGSAITLAATLLGIASATGRWLAIGTAEGANRFLRRAHDPLGVYRRRFSWLVRSSDHPITVFIDDLDRCRPEYVIELLEGIQTLFVDEPVAYVVAADRNWLCRSFAHGYSEFEETVGDLARPIGFLFLEKTFQISTEIPPLTSRDRERYWSTLLRGGEADGVPDPGPAAKPATDAFADTTTQGDVEDRIGALISSGIDGEEVLAAAMRRLNAPDMQEQLDKLLAEFAPLIENNPRSMKRLMNAYGIERDRLLRDGRLLSKQERRQLVLLTILRLRWPLLADHLRECPGDASFLLDGSGVSEEHAFKDLFDDGEVLSLFDGSIVQERLNAELITEFPPER